MEVVRVPPRILRAQNFNLSFNNPLVMSPVHEKVVEEVCFCVLSAC